MIGTGSEVHIALDAAIRLQKEGIATRVVSLPSWELFDAQSKEYRDSVLPPDVTKRISIEAGTPKGWKDYVGSNGTVIGITRFGASAPGEVVLEKLGISIDHIMDEAKKLLGKVTA